MDKLTLSNVSTVALGGRAPGTEFRVNAVDGQPVDLFWRNRLADGEVVVVPAVPVSPAPAEPAPAPARKAPNKKD